MVCLGLGPGEAGWKKQTNPLCHGGTPTIFDQIFVQVCHLQQDDEFWATLYFVNGPYPATFLYFHLFNTQLTVIKCSLKSCSRLDSNRGPLVSKVTALPTELQPLKTFVTSISLSVLQPNFWRTSQRRSDGCTSRRL